mmetsp:Transcript_14568/g.32122  ORF Transcript_14568/g.32122 Transcript_14568/m.32122 type:complete len:144 (-) Transcript_14568:173-604(-)
MTEVKMEVIPMEEIPGSVEISKMVVFNGCICCTTSLYTEMPDMIGCQGKRVCLCCYSEFLACKLPKQGEDVWLHWEKGYTYCAPIKSCCMNRMQCFCCDIRCSIPLNEEIPQVITFCFATCLFKSKPGFAFFKTVGECETLFV